MKTYVKNPVKIQAFKWDGSVQSLINNLPPNDMHKFFIYDISSGNGPAHKLYTDEVWKACDAGFLNYFNRFSGEQVYITTLEGPLKASKGDYIIRGIRGEYYSCKPDVFKATYDEVKWQDTSH